MTKLGYRIRGVGVGRICEAIRRGVARSWTGPALEIDDFMGNLKFMCDLREHMGSQIFWRGHYSGSQLRLLSRFLPRSGVFVDVGANHGEFAVHAASLVGREGRVIAVEPVSVVRQRLQKNIEINGFTNVEIVPLALLDRAGSMGIFGAADAVDDGTIHEGLPTLFRIDQRAKKLEDVAVAMMDDVLQELGVERIDMIKLDIEGGELAALKGGQRSLQRFKPILVFEVAEVTCQAAGHSPAQLLEWVMAQGYRIEILEHDGRTRRWTPSDALARFQNVVAMPDSK